MAEPGPDRARMEAVGGHPRVSGPAREFVGEENVRELAGKLDRPVLLPCDVTSDDQMASLPAAIVC